MARTIQVVTCLFLGLMALWWADLLFNNTIRPPRGFLLHLYHAMLAWTVMVLLARKR